MLHRAPTHSGRAILAAQQMSFTTTRVLAANIGRSDAAQRQTKKFTDKKLAEAEDAKAKLEIQVEIPMMPKEEIYLLPPSYRAEPWTPDAVSEANINKIYELPKGLISSISAIKGLPAVLKNEFSFFRRPMFLFRKSHLDLLSLVEAELAKPCGSRKSVLLDGKAGAGRSMSLLAALSYFNAKETFTIHMPSITWLLSGAKPFMLNAETKLYETPEATAEFMSFFQEQNSQLMDKLSLGKEYEFGTVKLTKANTLRDLVSFGIENVKFATSVFDSCLDELAQQTRFSVIISADMFNGFYGTTYYRDTNMEFINADKFTLAKTFIQYFNGEKTFKNGVAVMAMSGRLIGEKDVEESTEFARSQVNTDKTTVFDVPSYSQLETEEVLKYYISFGLVPKALKTPSFVRKTYMITGGNAYQMHQFALYRPLL